VFKLYMRVLVTGSATAHAHIENVPGWRSLTKASRSSYRHTSGQ